METLPYIAVLASKGITFVRGPIVLTFIVMFLSVEEQGVWFTFTSLFAAGLLAEFGLTRYVTNLLANKIGATEKITHDDMSPSNAAEVSGIISFAISTFLSISILVFPVLVLIGAYVFSDQPSGILSAWIILSACVLGYIFFNLFTAFLHAADRVSAAYSLRSLFAIAFSGFCCLFLYLDFSIWALPFAYMLSLAISYLVLIKVGAEFWKTYLANFALVNPLAFRNYVIVQSKYTVSWLSGVIVFHFLIPVVFTVIGPEMAGKLGLTLNLLRVGTNLSTIWFEVNLAKLNFYVAKRAAARASASSLKFSAFGYGTFGTYLLILWMAVYQLNVLGLGSRVLVQADFLMMVFAELCVVTLGFFAIYIRLYLDDEFYIVSILNAVFIFLAIFFLIDRGLSAILSGITIGYWGFLFPIALFTFIRWRSRLPYYG